MRYLWRITLAALISLGLLLLYFGGDALLVRRVHTQTQVEYLEVILRQEVKPDGDYYPVPYQLVALRHEDEGNPFKVFLNSTSESGSTHFWDIPKGNSAILFSRKGSLCKYEFKVDRPVILIFDADTCSLLTRIDLRTD